MKRLPADTTAADLRLAAQLAPEDKDTKILRDSLK